jgi:hypothetical protein
MVQKDASRDSVQFALQVRLENNFWDNVMAILVPGRRVICMHVHLGSAKTLFY